VPDLEHRRPREWTPFAAEPAVRAAERAIVTASPGPLAETLAVSTATEPRQQRAADEFRQWAAGVYLAGLRTPPAPRDRAAGGMGCAPDGRPASPGGS
jgi:hypothetical protein